MQIRLRTPAVCAPSSSLWMPRILRSRQQKCSHRLDSGLLLDQLAGDLRAHAGAGARTVRHVDAIDAAALRQLRAFDFLRRIHAARRQNLHERDELSRRQLRAQLRLSSPTGTFRSACAFGLRLFHRDAAASCCSGCSERASERISLMCSGVVPQQPPTILTPAHSKRRAYCAMYSGEHR